MKNRLKLDAGYSILDEHRESGIECQESYLCEGYKRFFDYAIPRFMQIAAEINASSSSDFRTKLSGPKLIT
jgi:hypothetical protein